ncbi:ABC-2 type transport system ATP-binding protein [Desulfobotulus alkaliphilus]|uniref:ABC-2 type transport system ATP-binding protein n=1 Tax=Desulfobotulus alkaliphilus TaxID=622671 RepID=A0A562RQ62_9BACT|nr:ATP-binding cassette domain-containing protein [Desulfobotulus alkaliphilus]TWI71235.1 ABC-2 type transport system ATP-binding protein [Desulfobotulus alkaliphilus]
MIEVKDLSKDFNGKRAVDAISFTVDKGEILGFLGPNGAGKSTTMRMITGYLPPSSGTAVIDGFDILTQPIEARARLGYLSETAPVYPEMSVREFLLFCAEVRGFSGKNRDRAADDAMDRCFLKNVVHQPIHTLSKGYRQRVSFAQSILHDPAYLILDEPTDGLDPNQKHEVRQMIQAMGEAKAILISTHILDEVEALCPRALIISEGRIVADDSPEKLRRQDPDYGACTLTLNNPPPAGLMQELSSLGEVRKEHPDRDTNTAKLHIRPRQYQPDLSSQIEGLCRRSGTGINELFISQGRLDTVFRMLTTPKNAA